MNTTFDHPEQRSGWQKKILLLLGILLAICISPSALAQSNATDAAIDGYVTDVSGGAIPNAHIVARNLATNIANEATADSNGYYRFPILKIGEYEVTVKADGFSELDQKSITLAVGSQIKVNAALKPGATTSEVTVSAEDVALETGSSVVGATLESKALRALPVISRNIYNFTFFSPGIKGYPTSTFSSPNPSFDGVTSSDWQLDGLDNTQRNGNTPIRLTISTPEVMEQTQVLSNGYSAEFGRTMGGILTGVTRSGTNDWHGSAFAATRPNAFRSTPALSTTGKPSANWNDFDGNLGGPIFKNRTFFFANFEYNRLINPAPVTISAANAQALGIPTSELGSAGVAERYPTPSLRVDHHFNENNNMFLRWTSFSNEEPNNVAGGLTPANTGTFFHDRQQGGEAQVSSVLSPSLLNEFRFGINIRDTWGTPMQPASASDVLITITNVANIGNSPTQGSDTRERNIEMVDDITKTVGKHTLKAGFDYANTDIRLHSALSRTYTFQTLANYLNTINGGQNLYQQFSYSAGNPIIDNSFKFISAFAQDQWRVTEKLTVNYGVRYDLILWPTLDQKAALAGSRSIPQSNLDFAPRLAITYAPNPNTVLRAAGGIYFDTPNLAVPDSVSQNNGDLLNNYTFTPSSGLVFPNLPSAISIKANVPNVLTYDPKYRAAYSIQSNAQVEQALGHNFNLSLQYQLLVVSHGPYSHDINLGAPIAYLADGRPQYSNATHPLVRPNTSFGQILEVSSGANASYHGLDVTINKRLSNGFQFGTTYSWSKALGTVDQANTSTPITGAGAAEDPTDLARDYGPLSSDTRHNWVFQGLYSPTFKGNIVKLLNGIQLSSMTYVHSGLPINISSGQDISGIGVTNARPLFVGRNAYRGSNMYQEDMRISYSIPFRERYHLEFRAESENLFNHPNLACTATSGCTVAVANKVTVDKNYLLPAGFTSASLTRTSVRNPRSIQFGTALRF